MVREEARLASIQSLSRRALSLLAPEHNPRFDREFGLWAANPARLAVRENLGSGETGGLAMPLSSRPSASREKSSPTGPGRGLDTTLVAGMFFQVLLEAEHLPGNTLERTSFVKQAVKNFLVQRLAGQITLSQFFRLVQIIEQEVTYYFHCLQGEWLCPEDIRPGQTAGPGASSKVVPAQSLQADVLRIAITRLPLPHQANRKLSPEGLFDFLVRSEGRWFRLLDFESQFRLNKKTAWTYLALLLQHDILRHNEEKANKVRYALAVKFLAPEAASLR